MKKLPETVYIVSGQQCLTWKMSRPWRSFCELYKTSGTATWAFKEYETMPDVRNVRIRQTKTEWTEVEQ